MNESDCSVGRRYDGLAGDYERLVFSRAHYGPRVNSFLNEHANGEIRLLDVGCGPGHLTAKLPGVVQVVGVDVSEEMVKLAQQARPSGRYLRGSFHEPLPREDFEVILAVGCLEFCENLDAVIGNLATSLRPGGRMLVTAPERSGNEPSTRELKRDQQGVLVMHLFTGEQMRAAAEKAGLVVDRTVSEAGWTATDGHVVQYGIWQLRRP